MRLTANSGEHAHFEYELPEGTKDIVVAFGAVDDTSKCQLGLGDDAHGARFWSPVAGEPVVTWYQKLPEPETAPPEGYRRELLGPLIRDYYYGLLLEEGIEDHYDGAPALHGARGTLQFSVLEGTCELAYILHRDIYCGDASNGGGGSSCADAKVAEGWWPLAVWGDGRFGGEGLTSANMMYDAGWAMWYCTGSCNKGIVKLKNPMPEEIIADEVINTPGYGSTLRVAAVLGDSKPGELTMKHRLPRPDDDDVIWRYEYEIAWGVDTSDYSFIPGADEGASLFRRKLAPGGGGAQETDCELHLATYNETKVFTSTLFDLAGGDLPHVTRGVYETRKGEPAEIWFEEKGHGGCYMSYILLREAPSEDYSTFFTQHGPSYALNLTALNDNGLVANGDVFRVRATVTNEAGLNTSIETGPLMLDWTAPVTDPSQPPAPYTCTPGTMNGWQSTTDAITLCLFDPPDTIGWSDDESGLARLKWSLHQQVDDDLLDYGELTDAETAIMLSEGTVEIVSGALPLASSLVSGEQYLLKVSISNKAGLHSDEVATPAFGIDDSAPVVIDADATFCDHLDYCDPQRLTDFYVGVY